MTRKFKGGNLKENVSTGFGLGIGIHLSSILFIIVGLCLFVPGFLLWNGEKKKAKDQRDQSKVILAFALMIFGCILALGMGFGFILGQMGEFDF